MKLFTTLTDKKFYLYLIISCLFFGIFINIEYATDTYNVLVNSAKDTVLHFIASGRFITAIFEIIIVLANISFKYTYIISFFAAILCSSLSMYILDKLFSRDIKNQMICALISILTIINVFSIELWMFIEKGIMWLSILFNILALKNLIEYFDGNKKKIFLTFIYMLLANFSYQGTVALFVALSVVYIIKYSINFKNFIKNNFVVALCYGIPAFINFATVKFIFSNSRVSGEINIFSAINKIFESIRNMIIETYSIIPKYVFIVAFGLIILYITIYIIKSKNTITAKIIKSLSVVYIILGVFISTMMPHIMQNTSAIWFVPRSTYALASILGILLLYFYINFESYNTISKIVSIIIILFLIVQFNGFQTLSIQHYQVNYMDKINSMQIKNEIEMYEKEKQIEITKVSFYRDMYPSYTYPGIKATGDINIKAFFPDWCVKYIFKYYVRENIEIIDNDSRIKEIFESKDWSFFDKEQLIFENDIVHICVF